MPSETNSGLNYFNYFTEIEEHFWQKREAHILVSPLDWAIVETWQKAGISLSAVLKGIDQAFDSYARSRRGAGGKPLKSLVYCVDAVLDAAEQEKETAAGAGPTTNRADQQSESFSRERLRSYFGKNRDGLAAAAERLRAAQPELAVRVGETSDRLDALLPLLDSPAALDLEDLERQLTVLEEKLTAALTTCASEEFLVEVRREMDRQLAAYRRRMTSAQIAQLERQYTQKRIWEQFKLPRLSLFYLP